MKVFLVSKAIYPERGGVELHVYRIAEGLLAMGHQVWALVEGQQAKETRGNGLRVIGSVRSGQLQQWLANHKPDVVHAHGSRNVFAARGLLAARRAGIRTVFTPHCFYPAQDFAGRLKRLVFDSTLGRAAVRACDRIICLTKNDYADALKLGAREEQLEIIPNSITLPRAVAAREAEQWRHLHGLHRFLLSVGRLDRVKRGDFLIRSLARLPEDVALVFAGPDAGCRDEWLRLAQDLGLEKRVKILGEVSDADLKAAYQTCSALVLASRYEGLPTVILEAMALGAPVVASATGGTSWLIAPGDTGFLFPYDDTAAFAAEVKSALGPDVKQMVARAREMVARQYSWEANLPRIAGVYAGKSGVQVPEAVAAGR